MNEREIIQGCQQNNRKYQRLFVDQYSKYLFGVCIRYVKNEYEAKDCLQDALVHILKNIGKYEDQGMLKAWLAKVTSMICLQYIRKHKKFESQALENAPVSYENERITDALAVKDVLQFLDTMPYNYRVAINMFLVEGYSHQEISQTLGITISSSRSLVSRGRKMIIDAFEKEAQVVEKKIKIVKMPSGYNKRAKVKVGWSS